MRKNNYKFTPFIHLVAFFDYSCFVSLKQNERHPDKVYSDKLFLGMVQKQ